MSRDIKNVDRITFKLINMILPLLLVVTSLTYICSHFTIVRVHIETIFEAVITIKLNLWCNCVGS